jgi:hypothetical protein
VNRFFAGADVGRKNIGFGIALFLILGVVVGIPLTIDFLGGTLLTSEQYQQWKVVHGYGVFLSFVNFFFGLCIDRLSLTKREMELSSWSFLLAGVVGGFGRPVLLLAAAMSNFGIYVSLVETALFVVGTATVVRGLMKERVPDQKIQARYSHAK